MLLRIAIPLLTIAGMGAGESSLVWGGAPSPLGEDAPPDEGSPAAPGKGSAGDASLGKGAADVSKSFLVISRVWPIKTSALEDRQTRHWRSRG